MSGEKLYISVEACAICDKDRDWREIPDGASCGHDPRKHREVRKVEVVPVETLLSEASLDALAESWEPALRRPGNGLSRDGMRHMARDAISAVLGAREEHPDA